MANVTCPVSRRPLAVADILSLVAAGFAMAAGIALLTVLGVSPGDDGTPLLVLPPVLAAGPVLAGGRRVARAMRIVVAILLTAFWFLAALSVGWFFAPAALFAIAAAAVRDHHEG